MKQFEMVSFNPDLGRQQVLEFRTLLTSKLELAESIDVLPFFRERQHLSILLGTFNPRIAWGDRIAYEFDVFGDFACDLAVGEWSSGSFCFIEFEDARANSVFEKQGKKVTREWSRRLDHGFGQIIDWLHKLDDRSGGYDFLARFGRHAINYEAVLVIGRDHHLDEGEKARLEWRNNNVVVNSKKVHCITFDQLLRQLSTRLSHVSFGAVIDQIGDAATRDASVATPSDSPDSPPLPPENPTPSGE